MNEFKLYLHFRKAQGSGCAPSVTGWVSQLKVDDLLALKSWCADVLDIHLKLQFSNPCASGEADEPAQVSREVHLTRLINLSIPSEKKTLETGGSFFDEQNDAFATMFFEVSQVSFCNKQMPALSWTRQLALTWQQVPLIAYTAPPLLSYSPCKLPEHQAAQATVSEKAQVPERAKRVIIAEDEEDMVYFMEKALRLQGFEVATAHDGEEAKKQIEAQCPDALLLDLGMPRLDGWQVLKWLREEAHLSIPTIIISGKGEMMDLKKGYDLAADYYMVKPIKLHNLIQGLHTVMLINSLPKEFEE